MFRLGRAFRIADDDGSRALSRYEFGKALRDFGMELSEEQVGVLYDHFDGDRAGGVDYDEFLRAVKVGGGGRRRTTHRARVHTRTG